MTLEERVGRLEVRSDELRDLGVEVGTRLDKLGAAGRHLAEGSLRMAQEVETLKAQLKELDVMVLAIHSAIKDVQERV